MGGPHTTKNMAYVRRCLALYSRVQSGSKMDSNDRLAGLFFTKKKKSRECGRIERQDW
jgi:hypothetical protein